MICRICLHHPNTAQCHMHLIYESVTIENIRISITEALRSIFPNLPEISKLDVPCLPTYICDSCLKFLLASYKFFIKCCKTNFKIKEILREHESMDEVKFSGSKHLLYGLSCPNFEDILKEEVRNSCKTMISSSNAYLTYKQSCNKESEFHNIILEVNYSLSSNYSLFRYLKLQKNDTFVDTLFKCSEPSFIEQQKFNNEVQKPDACNSLNGKKIDFSKFDLQYTCKICCTSFACLNVLKMHVKVNHTYPNIAASNSLKYECIECSKDLKTFLNLKDHLKQHMWYKCKVCQKQFLGSNRFEIHVKKNHSGYRPFQCPICGKLFKTKMLFFDHEKYTHENEKPYVCKICNRKWKNLINLDMHMRNHIGGKLLKCQDCDNSFDDADTLEQHRKVNHLSKKILHECDLCLAEFTNVGNLTKHMKTHKDYKPHQCVLCDRQFPTLRHLKNHISSKHEEQEVLMCELCDKTFLNEGELMAHIEEHA